jgi:hypothetical protein
MTRASAKDVYEKQQSTFSNAEKIKAHASSCVRVRAASLKSTAQQCIASAAVAMVGSYL